MPLQTSYAGQHRRPYRNYRPHSYGPRPPYPPPLPPPPPPPPIEISTTTKNKLKKFQFKPPRNRLGNNNSDGEPRGEKHRKIELGDEDRRPVGDPLEAAEMAGSSTAALEAASGSANMSRQSQKGSQRGSQKRSQARQTSQQKAGQLSTPAIGTTTAVAAPEGGGDSDKENNDNNNNNNALPSTQPNKVTPAVAATPEFLSIHVGTPRARFAWQDLAGTPDTPKVHESLGISPDAKLSWMTEQPQVPLPVVPKQGTKRTRSTSPPSSPSHSRSKRVAENVQKFKEVMASAASANLALEGKVPRKRNALARHRTEVARTTPRGAAGVLDAEPLERLAQDGRSPRGSPAFRRSMSCNTLPTKRRRVDMSESNLHQGYDANAPGVHDNTKHQSPPVSRPPSRQRPPQPVQTQGDQVETIAHARPVSPVAIQRLSLTVKENFPGGSESIPDTESNGPHEAQMTDKKADSLSDYGDDLFDDDMLAELDASLAPAAEPILVTADEQPSFNAGTTGNARDEFDDLDDDVFTAAEDLMAGIDSDNQPRAFPQTKAHSRPASNVDPGGGLGDMEDAYGDDFGEDFDFDAAEQAATQAATQFARKAAAPWANSQSSSQGRRAIQRYLVTNVLTSSYHDERQRLSQEKILVVQRDGQKSGAIRAVHLRGDWFDTHASVKSYVHVLGEFSASGVCVVDNDHNMLILHPDQLVSSTVVADSFNCTRRAVLQDRVKATSDASSALVYGTLLHEIFQDALMANQWSRSFLNVAVDKTIQKHLEDLYTIKVQVSAAREHLLTKTRELQYWAELFVTSQPKPDAVVQGRNGEKINMCVSKLLDVEEHVWSPMYGLKGNIDATVQVTMESGKDRKTLTVPFELKTGRNASSTHQAQTVLYNLLLSDRYDIEIVYGILYYMENSQMLRIPAIRHELRHMIMKRNELAGYVRERSVQLPPMLQSRNACGRCFAQTSCFIYHKLADDGTGETSGMGDKFDEIVGHLTPKHKDFFLRWEDLLTKEEKESHKLRRELWTMISAEREKLGRCFGDVIIEEGSAHEDLDNPKINRFRYTFVKENPVPGFSFMDSQLVVGEPIVVSDEQGHFALALGFVTAVRKRRIDVAVDRRLHNARIRQEGFHDKTNQVFAGIMEATSAKKQIKIEPAEMSTQEDVDEGGTQKQAVVRYRLDKDEFSNGMATVRNNLVQVMAGNRTGLRELRQLVVDLVPPRFKAVSTQYVIEDSKTETLNVDQKRAIAKVMSAQDYALVLGMPGTGKTTTIAHIIRALVRQGKSVLLTSYTHTAVDNILLKLKTSKTPILRLGAPAKVHPDVQKFAVLAGEPKTSFEAIRSAWHDTPIVATTCLGISHPVFSERTFDYCIVDEASQITLPICLGPIRMARTFVLVGDHNQLPPLVQNEEARVGGLDVSLFKLLSDTHPDSVVNLEHQYRMCEDIMTLSNTLIYHGRLRCGTEELRRRSLRVPDMARLHQHHHNADSVARLAPRSFCAMGGASCWLRYLLRPETRVAFVNTDAIEGSREEAKGNRTVNPCEARLVAQLVEGLLTVGVPASDIGVMTHYRSQLSLLKHQLRGITGHVHHQGGGGGGAGIEMHTADRFQGRDKEVVVLSLVRNNEACNIGDLLKDWRRINVAFTRAKTKLLVVGSRSTLQGIGGGGGNGGGNNNDSKQDADSKNDKDTDTGEEMLARFVRLMEERAWIYDLPSDALDNHLFEEFPTTQAGSARSPGSTRAAVTDARDAKRAPLASITSPRQGPTARTMAPTGKENRQPMKRARIGEGALLKGKPILQGILDDMMGGKYTT